MPKTPRVKSIRVRRRRPTCLGCSLRGLQCHYGTLAGNCTECGQHKPTLSFSDPSPHFSQVPNSFSELVQQAQAIFPLQPEGSPNSMLRIHTTTVVDGSKRTHTLVVPGGGYSFEKQMRDEMDLLVRQFCFPNKKWTELPTQLCQSAMDARGYLALLLSSHVKERRTTIRDGEDEDEDEVINGSNLALQLINFILPRLDELIGVVMDAFGKEPTNDDEDYWVDVATAAAILHKGLHSVHSDLVKEKSRPFCGGVQLTTHLRVQLKSAEDNLMMSLLDRGLGCSSALASHINACLDGLQCSILVENITLIQESQPASLEATGYSPQASSATAFSPYQSPGMEQVPSAGISDERHSFVALGAPDFYPVPYSAPYSEPLPTSCPAPLAMQCQVPVPPTITSASNQPHRQTTAGPSHIYPHGPYGLQLHPWMNPASQSSVQKTQYQSPTYKSAHHSSGPIWPMPTNKTVPAFGDSWPDPTVIRGFNTKPTADYFGSDSLLQGNLPEDEYYSPQMSSYVSSAGMFYPPPETSIPMASPFSAPFWSEEYVTWRQS